MRKTRKYLKLYDVHEKGNCRALMKRRAGNMIGWNTPVSSYKYVRYYKL